MTQEEIISISETYPLKNFLTKGIRSGTDDSLMERPVHNVVEDGSVVENWYDVKNGFQQSLYMNNGSIKSAVRSATREDLNSMLALGYNLMVRMVTGQTESFNERIAYHAGAVVRSEDTGYEFVAPAEIETNISNEISTTSTPSWIRRFTNNNWTTLKNGTVDDTIATVSWTDADNLPMALYSSEEASYTGTWQVCSFTMNRDLYGWICPTLLTHAFPITPELKWDKSEPLESASETYGSSWWLGDADGNFNIIVGSYYGNAYWGKGNSRSQFYNWTVSSLRLPIVAPIYYRKGETYKLDIELKNAFIVSPPGIPLNVVEKGIFKYGDFETGMPAFATGLRFAKVIPNIDYMTIQYPSEFSLTFTEMGNMIPPNRGF